MIDYLKLTNFRQHRDRTFDLKEGLVVLRGANEAGKSTLITSVLYLWFGAKVLGESLADVVTYGENEKTLRVEGSFTVDGVKYAAYRSASGAELQYGDQRVTGQTGVTQFMERLLGAKADVVRKLMVAEQNSVRGILESESEAGALVEGLANLGVIDVLIDKIKHQKPCGPTKGVEGSLQALHAVVGEVPVAPKADFDNLKSAVSQAEAALADAKVAHQVKVEEAEAGAAVVVQASNAQAAFSTVAKREATLREVDEPAPCEYTSSDVEKAEAFERDAAALAQAKSQKATEWLTCAASWTGDEASAEAELEKLAAEHSALTARVSDLKVRRATKLALKINDGVCSFCKKDISELPEVSEINTKVDDEVAALDTEIATCTQEVAAKDSDRKSLKDVLTTHRSNMAKRNPAYWEPVDGVLPAVMRWVGPEIADSQSLSVSSAAMKAAIRSYETEVVLYEAAKKELLTLTYPALVPESNVIVARGAVEALKVSTANLQGFKDAHVRALHALQSAEAVHASEMRNYETAVKARNSGLAEVAKTEQLLADMQFNNQLIDDLRSARAEIRRRLWASVTSAISVYFSRIRQVETRITQSEDGFLQNGKSVKGLSGSAKDMLGLAIRAALLKTFIPGAPLLVVDEPFSGCDEAREVAGLGVLSVLGFPQTILVTHSELADPLASQLIQL